MRYGCINCKNCHSNEDDFYVCAKEKKLDISTYNEVWFLEKTWDSPLDKRCNFYEKLDI